MMPNQLLDRAWKRLLLFAFVVALTYLPNALRLTYYRDDWYYAYDALVGPAGVFRALFAIDRPARGPFFEAYYALFGMAPIAYHLLMFFWRLAGGYGVVWLFSLLWSRQRQAGLAAGLLFALYPGFTWWVSGIEYQPMVASAALMVWSLGFTVQAVRPGSSIVRIVYAVAAIVSGWFYLSLVEYAAGLEIIRLLLVHLAVEPPGSGGLREFWKTARLALRRWLVFLIIPVGFATWRFLIFSSQRKATNLGAQLGGFMSDPVSTGLHWFVNFLLSLINVTLSAWVVPLMSTFFGNSLREMLLGFLLALLAALAGWFLLSRIANVPTPKDPQAEWSIRAMWLGVAGIVLGIIPVIVANREISFPNFSHYALPASLGLSFFVVGLVSTLASRRLQGLLLGGLILLCALTHQGLGANAVKEERLIANFWQQMAWRAPSIAPGTTLLAYYPGLDYADDTDIVWGPADYIYYPGGQPALPVRAPISALTLDNQTLNNILLGHDPQESLYRAHTMTLNFDRILILSQPAEDACVHVIDARWPILSLADAPALRVLAPFSRVDDVVPAGSRPGLPPFLFGPEPKHAWCYYFQKAALASQQGNWGEVSAVAGEVSRLGLHPNDQVEWMPFLQAGAYQGDMQQVKEIATRINTEKLYKQQACRNLDAMARFGYPLSADMQAYVNGLFCGGGQ
jgi:hypothetical protein